MPSDHDRADPSLASAYAACEQLARTHYENFPVASWLLPRGTRKHVAAVYAFARIADDFADAGDRPAAERLRLLDVWRARLQACAADPTRRERSAPAFAQSASARQDPLHDAVFLALGQTIRRHRLPLSLFEDLLSAFRQDVTTSRYQTWADLLDYCRRSANPVGRLVLRIAGYENAELDRASDCVCSALQLTNFWQDLEDDWRRGRLYVPADDRANCEASETDLDARVMTPAWQQVLERVSSRTRMMFAEGRPVCDGVRGSLRFELRLTWLGGMRILERLAEARYDVFAARPTLGAMDAAPIVWRALRWKSVAEH
ncbi:MAG: squalene synthase HpnC [Dehalococcoidia bacterium]|nr:squalene synthase HpnC [Dehalococcoidia bacterium]